MPKAIVHLDADAFFASVEQASDSRLRGKPIAVGGEKRGIIASASYEARKFGVYTPMPTIRARKLCPKLIVLPGDYERYEHFSKWMFSYAYDFTPDVEQTSIDEGYFDLSGTRKAPAQIALTIRKAIGQSLKISVSEGIGINKLVSQIASKINKPAAFLEVSPGQEISFLHPLPNKWLPGIGPKASVRLNSAGLALIGQIAGTPLDLLHVLMGNGARTLLEHANGIDTRPIIHAREPQKSFSQQETFEKDLTDAEYLEATLRRMADNLFAKVREEGRSIRTLTVKVRYNDMGEDQVSESLNEPTDLETDVYGRLHTMLDAAWKRRVSLRLVSLKLSNVYDGRFRSELALDVPAHHIESPAMVSLCRMCNVREIDGLVAIVSVIRPGAANEGKKMSFTRRYQGLEKVTYPHPSLENCLKSTYGLVVYEEHILQISEAFAGLNPGRADVLRRALNKQNHPLIEKICSEFFKSALARGHSPEKTAEVWGLVTGFAGYAFCKAHSTAYGVEAYQSAWLKKYYPVEFMAAVLSNGKGFYHPIVYVLECHRLGITLQPPSINKPGPMFAPERQSIRVPVRYIKGLTEKTSERILKEHKSRVFESLADFYRRVGPSPEELELLLRVGAFDQFGKPRTAQFWECQFLQRSYGGAEGQGLLLPPPGIERLPEMPLKEPSRRARLESEDELLGFPASGHPLELHDDIAWNTYCPVSKLGEHVGEEVVTCGLVIEQRTHHQMTGEPMKFMTLADWTGMVETELFAQTYRSYGLATVRYPVLEIVARVEPYENGRGFSLRVYRAGKPRAIKLNIKTSFKAWE